MPIKKTKNIKDDIPKVRKFFANGPRLAGLMAVEFFKRSFRQRGFYDQSFEKWRPRKPSARKNKGRGLLIDSGRLRRSIRIISIAPGAVLVGTDVEYAKIHNEGGQIKRQVTVRNHIRKAHKRTWKGKVQNVKETIVFKHQRQMNLMIPKRKFLGNSAHLNKRITQKFVIELRKIL